MLESQVSARNSWDPDSCWRLSTLLLKSRDKRLYGKAPAAGGYDAIFFDATLMTSSHVTRKEGLEAHTLHPKVNYTLVTVVEIYGWRTFQILHSVCEISTDNTAVLGSGADWSSPMIVSGIVTLLPAKAFFILFFLSWWWCPPSFVEICFLTVMCYSLLVAWLMTVVTEGRIQTYPDFEPNAVLLGFQTIELTTKLTASNPVSVRVNTWGFRAYKNSEMKILLCNWLISCKTWFQPNCFSYWVRRRCGSCWCKRRPKEVPSWGTSFHAQPRELVSLPTNTGVPYLYAGEAMESVILAPWVMFLMTSFGVTSLCV